MADSALLSDMSDGVGDGGTTDDVDEEVGERETLVLTEDETRDGVLRVEDREDERECPPP